MEVISANKENMKEIVAALKNGAVLVLPTDTIYGLVCDAANEKAVGKIFDIKKRPKSKPLLVFVKDINQAKNLAFINKKQEDFLKKNWPGAVTVILKAKKGLSDLVYKDDTIGLRIPNYELLNQILNEFGKPLAQTSANIFGEGLLNKISDIKSQFKNEDILIVDAGDLPKNKPSKIIDLTSKHLTRLR